MFSSRDDNKSTRADFYNHLEAKGLANLYERQVSSSLITQSVVSNGDEINSLVGVASQMISGPLGKENYGMVQFTSMQGAGETLSDIAAAGTTTSNGLEEDEPAPTTKKNRM